MKGWSAKALTLKFQSVKIIRTKAGSQDVTHLSLIAIIFQPRNLCAIRTNVNRG